MERQEEKKPLHPTELLVDGKTIKIRYLTHPSESPASNTFIGGKSIHIFKMKKKEKTQDDSSKKKGNQKWWQGDMHYISEFEEGAEEVLKHGIITLKVDGTNGYVFEFEKDGKKELELYRRQDRRLTKEGEEKWKRKEELEDKDFTMIEGGIPCQEKPFGNHYPVQRPLTKGDKWEMEAFKRAKEQGKLVKGSVEIVGRKIQVNADGYDIDSGLVYHGMVIIDVPIELRSFDGMLSIFKEFNIEGFILYHNGKVMKIRRDGFMFNDHNLHFPDKHSQVTISSPLWC